MLISLLNVIIIDYVVSCYVSKQCILCKNLFIKLLLLRLDKN